MAPPVDIPSAPLVELTKVKLFGSTDALKRLQLAIDALSKKAKSGAKFTSDEKTFLVELFECFSLGGKGMGYWEAAALADHYVHGAGATLQLDATVYAESVIVRDTQAAMKKAIEPRVAAAPAGAKVSLGSADALLLRHKEFVALTDKSRKLDSQGRMLTGGWLLTEQDNQRLQKANNRFQLSSTSQSGAGGAISTTWRVDDEYVFEPFAKGFYTELHLRPKMVLRLPDGLSEHMTRIGIAKAFKHYAEWTEVWTPAPADVAQAPPSRPTVAAKKTAAGKKLPAQPALRVKH